MEVHIITPHVFTVRTGPTTHEVMGRAAAINEAKTLSTSRRGPVVLERKDQRVEMDFRNGALHSYRYESNRRKR